MKAVLAQMVSCCVHDKLNIIMQHMHGIIPHMFDCWTEPVVHLLLQKSSMLHYTLSLKYSVCLSLFPSNLHSFHLPSKHTY